MIYILEGPDRCGKTTLGKAIATKLKGNYIHASGHKSLMPGMTAFHSGILDIAEWAQKQGISTVIDRLWVSEMVYGELLRPKDPGHVNYKVDQFRIRCSKLGVTYIFCMTKDAVSRHAMDRDHEHAYTDSQFKQIVEGYTYIRDIMSTGLEKVISYDFEEDGYDINKWLEAHGI